MKSIQLITCFIFLFELSSYSQSFFRSEISKCDFRDITLEQAIQNLQRKSQDVDKQKLGFNYVFTQKAQKMINKKISLSLNQLPLFEAIKYTTLTLKMEVKFELRTVIIFAPGEKYQDPVIKEKFVKKDPRLLQSLKLRCQVIQANQVSLNDILRTIKDQAGKSDKNGKGVNVLNISGGASKITLNLKNLSAYEALRYTCIASGVKMKLDRSAVVIQKK